MLSSRGDIQRTTVNTESVLCDFAVLRVIRRRAWRPTTDHTNLSRRRQLRFLSQLSSYTNVVGDQRRRRRAGRPATTLRRRGDDAATSRRRRGESRRNSIASSDVGVDRICLRRASAARKQRVRISRRISAAAGLDNLPLRLSSRKSRAPDGRRQEASASRRTGRDGGDERTVVVDNGRV